MSLFLILACLVALAALAILLAPLWRSPRDGQESASVNEEARKLRDQLRELGKLHAEGALDNKQYTRRKAGLERKLVDIMVDAPAQLSAPARPSRSLGLALSAFIVVVAAGGYAWVGTPQALTVARGAADAASTQQQHALSNEQIEQMLDKLVARLKEEPDNAEGWIVLARSYAVMGRHAEALPAFRRAAELRKDDPVLLADYADTLAVTQGRKLDGEPMRLIEQALKLDPDNVKALSLAGTFAFNQKDYAGAIRQWERVLQVAPADSPLAMQIRSGVDEARQLAQGKVPAAAAPGPAAPAPAATPAATAGASAISGTVSLAPSLAAKTSPDDTVFVFARPAEGPRMPLAIVRKQVKDLPFRFELDDSMAMTPQSRLSAFPQVVVGARVSKSGRAVPEPGDLEGLSQPVAVGTRDLAIEIRDVVATR